MATGQTEAPRAFPAGFTWGTATAAHQIEGGNTNNDWWAFEHAPPLPRVGLRRSRRARRLRCLVESLGAEDADLVAGAGASTATASRSRWSRIEPADGRDSRRAALEHYRAQVRQGLRAQGIDPVVTFHHFTTPRWLVAQGGWESEIAVERFGRFLRAWWPTPWGASCRGPARSTSPTSWPPWDGTPALFPPGKNQQEACSLTSVSGPTWWPGIGPPSKAIRAAAPGVPVGLTLSMTDYQLPEGGEKKLESIRHHAEDAFLDGTGGDDFLGVQTYTRMRIGADGWAGVRAQRARPRHGLRVLSRQALSNCPAARLGLHRRRHCPCWSPRTGSGTTDDAQRIDYVRQALHGVLDAIGEGIDVRGYTYWSLLDNFEWAFGYRPRFGLVSVDRTTFARTAKPSAAWLSSVAAANALPARPSNF